jgi:hypothetical protein
MGFFSSIIRAIGQLGGNDSSGNYSAWGMAPSSKTAEAENAKKVAEASAAAKKAAHDAEVAQLAQNTMGAVQMRRRRGLYATILTGTGASPQSSGKTVLGS